MEARFYKHTAPAGLRKGSKRRLEYFGVLTNVSIEINLGFFTAFCDSVSTDAEETPFLLGRFL